MPPFDDRLFAFQGYNSAADDRKGPGAVRERLRGEQTELNWLMRTTYIAHDAPGKARQKDSAALPNGEAASASSREELLQNIEVSTSASNIGHRIRNMLLNSLAVSLYSWAFLPAAALQARPSVAMPLSALFLRNISKQLLIMLPVCDCRRALQLQRSRQSTSAILRWKQ